MGYANNRQIPDLIAAEKPFTGNTMSGEVVTVNGDRAANYGRLHPGGNGAPFVGHRLRYIVYSYETPIAAVTEDGYAIFIDDGFSQTTRRHQSAARWGLRDHPKESDHVPTG